jgi:septal ring factor EnvC (AmiA/AmiB activator)
MSTAKASIEELKAAIQKARDTAKNLLSNLTRIEKEYSDWEDRIVEIEKAIQEVEDDTGLSKEDIVKPISKNEKLNEELGLTDFLE